MPGRIKKLALLTVPQAFGLDELHGQLQSMYRESFSDPAHWRALMAPSVLPAMAAADRMGTDRDPNTWFGDMAARGLPGTENSDRFVPPGMTEQGTNDMADAAEHDLAVTAPGATGRY